MTKSSHIRLLILCSSPMNIQYRDDINPIQSILGPTVKIKQESASRCNGSGTFWDDKMMDWPVCPQGGDWSPDRQGESLMIQAIHARHPGHYLCFSNPSRHQTPAPSCLHPCLSVLVLPRTPLCDIVQRTVYDMRVWETGLVSTNWLLIRLW